MMFNFPFYPFHNSRYYANLNPIPYYNYANKDVRINPKSKTLTNTISKHTHKTDNIRHLDNYKNRKTDNNCYDSTHLKNKQSTNLNDLSFSEFTKDTNETLNNPVFNLFGLQLYYDDILLICLIFFLYTEGIKDDFLFIVLVLLLIS